MCFRSGLDAQGHGQRRGGLDHPGARSAATLLPLLLSPLALTALSCRQVLEISDLKHRVTYELLSSEPAAPYASAVSKITLRPVTDNDTTFIGEPSFLLLSHLLRSVLPRA